MIMENPCLNMAASAEVELELSERVYFRCVENGISFPEAWIQYRKNLRPYLTGEVPAPLPVRPEFPV